VAEVFRFYEQQFDGTMAMPMRHEESPRSAGRVREEDRACASGPGELGAAGRRRAGRPAERSAYVSLTLDSAEEAERVYALLSDGGQIFMTMEPTFLAARFAMLRDRFGTSWMLLAR
jgi:PhnB protein